MEMEGNHFELTPAYGRNPKTAKEVKALWNEGKDFQGDYQLGFKYCSKGDFPKGKSILLRYKNNEGVTVVKT